MSEMAHGDALLTPRSDAPADLQRDNLLLEDAWRGDSKKDQGKADTMPKDQGKADTMPKDLGKADTMPKDLGKSDSQPGPCLSWAGGWYCSSDFPTFCAANCGVLLITCADAAGKCRCDNTVTKLVQICSNPITGYCQNCKEALASSCCQGL